MTCDQFQERWVDHLQGVPLSVTDRAELERHREACPECRADATAALDAWHALGRLPEAQPAPQMRARFAETLDAYRAGSASGIPKPSPTPPWLRWWPTQPAAQAALALGCLVLGVGAGRLAPVSSGNSTELAGLREEVGRMRQLVALSLLQQQSPSDRLRGVTVANELGQQADDEVVSALLTTMRDDSNVNVRLAAVDALGRFGAAPEVRQQLAQSLPHQGSPLVQIAIIDLLLQLRDRQAVSTLRQLTRDQDANPAVRRRAERGLRQLEMQ